MQLVSHNVTKVSKYPDLTGKGSSVSHESYEFEQYCLKLTITTNEVLVKNIVIKGFCNFLG